MDWAGEYREFQRRLSSIVLVTCNKFDCPVRVLTPQGFAVHRLAKSLRSSTRSGWPSILGRLGGGRRAKGIRSRDSRSLAAAAIDWRDLRGPCRAGYPLMPTGHRRTIPFRPPPSSQNEAPALPRVPRRAGHPRPEKGHGDGPVVRPARRVQGRQSANRQETRPTDPHLGDSRQFGRVQDPCP
jgi:hypothetical protein